MLKAQKVHQNVSGGPVFSSLSIELSWESLSRRDYNVETNSKSQ